MIDALVAYMRNTPMYRSMLYFLLSLLAVAIGLCFIDVLPYDPWDILLTSAYLMVICHAGNRLLANWFDAKPNPESSLITAAILALLFGPMPLVDNLPMLTFLGLAAMASKYLLVWRQNHVFNPAALGAIATAVVFGTGASWWVGSMYLFPVVLIGGLYEAYKANRMSTAFSFLGAYAVFFIVHALFSGTGLFDTVDNLQTTLVYSPVLFFVFVMLIEPLTSPAQRIQRLQYAVLTAFLVVWLPEILPISYTLELSLLTGNAFAALIGNQGRLLLTLKKRERLASNIFGFWFTPSPKRQFTPGQFLHYTLPHKGADMRGIRRFFTIASSPTEDDILLVSKFAEKSSSFKTALQAMKPGDEIAATRPEGEFVLPDDPTRPLVFVAGGIGVTPFRSIIKYLADTNQKRPITLIYAAKEKNELVFKDLFEEAAKVTGLKTTYVLDNPSRGFEKGPLTAEIIEKHSPKPQEALFYLSGPEPMVRSLISQLKQSGIPAGHIKHDYFPGY